MKKQIRIYIYIIGLILIDQLSKVWALSALRGTEGIAVIPNVFELSYLENRGAAFGILQDHQIFFVLITVAAAVILTWIYRRIPQTKKYIPLRISYALIMAGAFGNLIDRVFRGYVVDFFYFKWIDFLNMTIYEQRCKATDYTAIYCQSTLSEIENTQQIVFVLIP